MQQGFTNRHIFMFFRYIFHDVIYESAYDIKAMSHYISCDDNAYGVSMNRTSTIAKIEL